MTVLVKIKNKKARKILEDLASMNIIEIFEEPKKNPGLSSKTLIHLASETSLSKTWNNAIEDKAWQNL